jgi:segregation and condensation protein A
MVDVIATAEVDSGEESFIVELERFQGPLELLLHLIREQDIDIFDIPIAQITAQFLHAIHRVERTLGLDRAGEFLETAAMLVRIKAQMLLPRRQDEAGVLEDPRAELVRRLLEYEHFRDAAERFEAAELDRRRRFRRAFAPPREIPKIMPSLEVTWDEVYQAALGLEGRVPRPEEHRVASRIVSLEDKIALIVRALREIGRIEFSSLVNPFADRLHSVMTLMAGLELARRRQIGMKQKEPFTSLWFHRTKEPGTDATDADHRIAAVRE